MKRLLLHLVSLLVLSLPLVHAQGPNTGNVVRINVFPQQGRATHQFFTGTNLIYACYASTQAPSNTGIFHTWSNAASTLTSVAVAANVGTITWPAAYGLIIGNPVTISGSATAGLNGTYYIQTTPSSTTATITTSGVANSTSTDVTLTTTAPPEIDPLWAILFQQYDGSNNLLSIGWGYDVNNRTGFGLICANRAVTTGATRIVYK